MSHKLFLEPSEGSEGAKLLLWPVGPSLVWHFCFLNCFSFYWEKTCSRICKSLKCKMLLSGRNKLCTLLRLLSSSLTKLKTEKNTSQTWHEVLDSLPALLRDSVSRGFVYKSTTYSFKAETNNPTQVTGETNLHLGSTTMVDIYLRRKKGASVGSELRLRGRRAGGKLESTACWS